MAGSKPVVFFKISSAVLLVCAILALVIPATDDEYAKTPNDTHYVLANAVLLSLTALIFISLLFEYIQHQLHHHTKDVFMPVLHALNSELMGIGFLAIIFYLMEVRYDVLTTWGTSTICSICDPCLDFPKVQHVDWGVVEPWSSAENPYHKDFNPLTTIPGDGSAAHNLWDAKDAYTNYTTANYTKMYKHYNVTCCSSGDLDLSASTTATKTAVAADLYAALTNGDEVLYNSNGDTAPTALTDGTTYYAYKDPSGEHYISVMADHSHAVAGNHKLDIKAGADGTHHTFRLKSTHPNYAKDDLWYNALDTTTGYPILDASATAYGNKVGVDTFGGGNLWKRASARRRKLQEQRRKLQEEQVMDWAVMGPRKPRFKGESRVIEAFSNMYNWAAGVDPAEVRQRKYDRRRRKLGGAKIYGVGCNMRLCQDAYNQTFPNGEGGAVAGALPGGYKYDNKKDFSGYAAANPMAVNRFQDHTATGPIDLPNLPDADGKKINVGAAFYEALSDGDSVVYNSNGGTAPTALADGKSYNVKKDTLPYIKLVYGKTDAGDYNYLDAKAGAVGAAHTFERYHYATGNGKNASFFKEFEWHGKFVKGNSSDRFDGTSLSEPGAYNYNGESTTKDGTSHHPDTARQFVDLTEDPHLYDYALPANAGSHRDNYCDRFHKTSRRYLYEFEEANPGYLTAEKPLPTRHSSFDDVYDAILLLPILERHELLHGPENFEEHRRLGGGQTGECFHCDTHLLHLFEDVHMTLFLVMVLYFVRSSFLIWQADQKGQTWMKYEDEMKTTLNPEKVIIKNYYEAYKKGSTMETMEASKKLEYMLLRKRFLQTGKSSGALDPPDFNFAFYLSIVYGHQASHVVHIPPRAWMLMEMVFVLFWGVMQAPPEHRIRAFVLCMLCLAAACMQLMKKMCQIKEQLICKIPHPSKTACAYYADDDTHVDELLEMLGDNDPRTVPSYLKNRPSKHGNQQELCFWGGKEGYEYVSHATRLMMINMLIYFILCIFAIPYAGANDEDFKPIVIISLIIFIPMNIFAPPYIIEMLSVTSSVELMKNPGAIKQTERHVKLSRSMRTIKMLRSLQMVVKQKKLAKAAKPGAPKPAPPPKRELTPEEKVQQQQMKEVFELFDASGDGQVDIGELGGLMGSLGVHLEEEEKELLMKEFDTGGDGQINFEEFWSYMLARNQKEDPHQVVEDVFEMIDTDGSKSLTTEEFAKVLLGLPALKISENDVNQLVREIDSGGDGEISIHEFASVLEKYQ